MTKYCIKKAGITVARSAKGFIDNINEFLKVYPTASYGEIYVNYNANSRYSIYNLNGVLIKWGEIYSGENKINLNTINKGVYLIKVANEVAIIAKTII